MTPEEQAASDAAAALAQSSAVVKPLESATSTDAQRINDLMSKWQKEEAESTRLRSQLAVQITTNGNLEARVKELEDGTAGAQAETTTALQAAEAKVAELTASLSTKESELVTLRFVAANPDLAQYASLLPNTDDAGKLAAAAATIRTARDADKTKTRDALTTHPRSGQVARSGNTAMSAKELDNYLSTAKNPAEFEQRLREVTGQAS